MHAPIRLLALFALLIGCAPALHADARPNFIVLLTDDQRPETLSCYNPDVVLTTPHIDQLADEGVRFERGYVTTPICAVSRASIITGRYASNHAVHEFLIPPTNEVFEASYPVAMRDGGYFVGQLGKYGVGITPAQQSAFDFFEATPGQGPRFREHNGETLHDAEWLTVKTGEFLDAVPEGVPFCLQVNYKEPHASSVPAPEDDELLAHATFERHPADTPEQFATLPPFVRTGFGRVVYKQEYETDGSIDPYLRQYHEKVVSVDRSVGAIRAMLRERGLDDNTVIIFLSDHGTHYGEKQLAGKWSPYDPSLRVPFILHDPRAEQPEARSVNSSNLVLNIDIAPTLLGMARIDIPEEMDGVSLEPLLDGESAEWRDRFFFEHFTTPAPVKYIPRNEGVRTSRHKYVRWTDLFPVVEELYDLESDPHETTNLASDPEHAGTLRDMRRTFWAWRDEHPRNYPYNVYGPRPQALAQAIDWERFARVRPQEYERIASAIEALGVTWTAAVEDWPTRYAVCSRAGYWY